MADDAAEMTAERFAFLAEAYGSSLHRWPEAERAAASSFANGEAGRAFLSRARSLDAMLDTYAVEAPATALSAQVLRQAEYEVPLRRRLRLFWRGLGLVGVGLAGAFAGALAVMTMMPRGVPDALGLSPVAAAIEDLGTGTDGGHGDR